MDYPSLVSELQQLRSYKDKNDLSAAQVATEFTALGWSWTENHLFDLMIGKMKMTAAERTYIQIFLLNKFYDYNNS